MIDFELIKSFSINKSDWVKVRFGDIVYEPKESVKDPVAEGIEHVVGLEHIDSEDIHLRRSASIEESTTFTKKFTKGDVLFGRRRAYLKKAAKADFDGICSGDITVMRANEKLLPELLPFIVNNDKFFDYAITHSAGGLSPRVKFKDLARYELEIPPLSKQKELLGMLSCLEKYMESTLVQQERLEILKKTLIHSLQNSSQISEKLKIRDLMKFHYGSSLISTSRVEGKYPVVSSSGVQGSHTDFLCEGPGVVVGRKGNVGQVTYVEENFWTIDTAYYIEINDKYKNIPLIFFYYLLESANLNKYSIATAVPGLNRDDALLTNVLVPNKEFIFKFLNKMQEIEKSLSCMSSFNENFRKIKNSILGKVF